MNLEVKVSDPLNILSSTKPIIEKAQFVQLNENGMEQVSGRIQERLNQGLESAEAGFGATGDFKPDVQLIFLQTATNFCFWAEKDKPRWQVEWKGKNISGFYALAASFQRALIENPQILDANYLSNISNADVEHLFRSNNGTEIPLLSKRTDNLQEAGKVLKERYNGQFINAMEDANFDAIEIAELLYRDFNSFKDVAQIDGKEVVILKRAQIAPNDLSYLSQIGGKNISNLDALTAFADYKIPQMLRDAGIIKYSDDLAERVDNYVLIPAGSREEVEIRAATIWGIELLRQRLSNHTANEIDNALWLLSQDQTGLKPYHRTYTTFY